MCPASSNLFSAPRQSCFSLVSLHMYCLPNYAACIFMPLPQIHLGLSFSVFMFMIPVYLGDRPELPTRPSASLPVWTFPGHFTLIVHEIGTSASPRPGIPFCFLRVLIPNPQWRRGFSGPFAGGITRVGTEGLVPYLHPSIVETASLPEPPRSRDPAIPGMWFSSQQALLALWHL